MATIRQVIEGLEVLAVYGDDQYVNAEHDVIFAGHKVGKDDLSPAGKRAMEKSGWFWSDEADSWARYT